MVAFDKVSELDDEEQVASLSLSLLVDDVPAVVESAESIFGFSVDSPSTQQRA
jgi:hypothetical protein